MQEIHGVPGLKGINRAQRLYVIPAGDGFTCLGFDVAYARTVNVAEWLRRQDLLPPKIRGTARAWRAYITAMNCGAARYAETGERCPDELTPQLVGLEGRRVEVLQPGAKPRRFYVGKSTGWMPCHLEIARRNSSGGFPVYLPEGATVRVIAGERR